MAVELPDDDVSGPPLHIPVPLPHSGASLALDTPSPVDHKHRSLDSLDMFDPKLASRASELVRI